MLELLGGMLSVGEAVAAQRSKLPTPATFRDVAQSVCTAVCVSMLHHLFSSCFHCRCRFRRDDRDRRDRDRDRGSDRDRNRDRDRDRGGRDRGGRYADRDRHAGSRRCVALA